MISFKYVKGSQKIPSILVLATIIFLWGGGWLVMGGISTKWSYFYFFSLGYILLGLKDGD